MNEDEKVERIGLKYKSYFKQYKHLSLPPHLMTGLTRREREIKQIILLALDQLRTTNNLEELRYWLTEWDPKQYTMISKLNERQVWQKLFDGVKVGFTEAHEEFCEKIVRGQPYLEKLWQVESRYAQDTSKS